MEMENKSFIASYSLSYEHRVNICVSGTDAVLAHQLVMARFDDGTLWDKGNKDCYLVYDDFEETDNQPLVFDIVDATAEDCVPDASITTLRLHEAARDLLLAAKAVISSWATGDLAYEAVRDLETAVQNAETIR